MPNRTSDIDLDIDEHGQPIGLQRAIEDAIQAALKSFAPQLVPGAPMPATPLALVDVAGVTGVAPLKVHAKPRVEVGSAPPAAAA